MAGLVAIVGPTASGKTALGLELAQGLGGEIISVDSMQVYRGMDIGTAKPSLTEQGAVQHHLLDILNPDQPYNAGQFALDAKKFLLEIQGRGKVPILLGGSHLYHKALIYGIISLPEVSLKTKKTVADFNKEGGKMALYHRLSELDPLSARRLHPNDIARVTRALEVVLDQGESLTKIQEKQSFKKPLYPVLYLARQWSRETLYQRINQRGVEMVKEGLVQETERLLKKGYGSGLQSLRSIGYKQATAFLSGEINQAEMILQIQQATRRYAKKQLTWVARLPQVRWVRPEESGPDLLKEVRVFLDEAQ